MSRSFSNSFHRLTEIAKTVQSVILTTLGSDLKRRLSFKRFNKGIKILPIDNGFSDSPSGLKINSQLADLKHNTPIRNGMMEGDCIRGDFALFRQIAGYTFNPLGSVPVREPMKPSQEYLNTLTWFSRVCAGFIPSSVRIDKESTTGYSQGVKAHADYKISCFENFDLRIDDILRLSDSTKSNGRFFLDTLEYQIEHANVEGRRTQAEKISREGEAFIPKLRDVYDCFGKIIKVDRTTPFHNFFSMRSRLVYASSATFNYGLSYYGSGWRAFYFNKLPFLFKHDMLSIGDKIGNRKFLLSIDFSNFDQNMDQSYTDTLFNNCTHFDPSLITYIKRCLGLPMIIKNDYLGGQGIYVRNHDVPKGVNVYGNPSGLTFVSDIAKLVGASVALTLLKTCFNLSLDELEIIIKGDHPRFAVFNGGDDNLFAFLTESDKNKFNAFIIENGHLSGYKIEVEKTPVFLGHDLVASGSKIKAIQDVRNVALKIQLAENEIGRGKPFFKLGFWLRQELLKDHPSYKFMFDTYEDMIKKEYGVDFNAMFNVDKTPVNLKYVNLADAYFMENPEYIYYKLDPEEVSKELLDETFITIHPERVKKLDRYVTY